MTAACPGFQPGQDVLLTVCVPTYNRGRRAKALVTYLKALLPTASGKLEIVVSNNCSTDDTTAALDAIEPVEGLTIHHRTAFLPTAEEHMFAAISLCRGQYVWFLGDDDVPDLATVEYALNLIETGTTDFIYFNSPVVNEYGALTGAWFVTMNAEQVELDFATGAATVGFTSNFPGISNSIYRREPLLRVDLEEIRRATPIYTHVAWWAVAFRAGRMTIVNRPLARYTVDNPEEQLSKFVKHAEDWDLPDRYFWTIGLVRLMSFLEKEKVFTPTAIRNMWESRRDGSRFRFLEHVIFQFFEQACTSASDPSPRNRLSAAETEECLDWVLGIDPGYAGACGQIRTCFAVGQAVPNDKRPARLAGIRAEFQRYMTGAASSDTYIGLYGKFDGFDIYRTVMGFVAFDNARPIDRQQVLRYIDYRPTTDDVLVADSLDQIRAAIEEAAPRRIERARLAENQHLAHAVRDYSAGQVAAISEVALAVEREYERRAVEAMLDLAKPPRRSLLWRLFGAGAPVSSAPGFDEDFYLAMNPEIAATGIDPLSHFRAQGWREGRDPCVHFSVSGYLAANPDIRAAGVDPLEHFLKHGRKEGRRGWRTDGG